MNQTASTDSEIKNVELDALILDRPLKYPVMDSSGRLLLAEGMVLTAELKEHLKARGSLTIMAHADDILPGSLPDKADADEAQQPPENEVPSKNDNFLGSGLMSVRNTGPPVRQKLVSHGCKPYDTKHRADLLKRHKETGRVIHSMMTDVMQGSQIEAVRITEVTSIFLADLLLDIDIALSTVSDTSHFSLSDHCIQMSLLGMAIGVEMNLDEKNVRTIGLAGLVHDWGMNLVPDTIRFSNKPLTPAQFVDIQKHPTHTWNLLEKVSAIPSVVRLVALQVHERPNGSGYPRGRTGNNIHPLARILHVADAYVAMTSPRPYRPAFMPYSAMECLLHQVKINSVDPDVVRCLLNVITLFPIGSSVELSDGRQASVIRRNGNFYTAPIVEIIGKATRGTGEEHQSIVIDLSSTNLTVVRAVPTPGRNEIALSENMIVRNVQNPSLQV